MKLISIHHIKNLRNDFYNFIYLRIKSRYEDRFIEENKGCKNIFCVIAFEHPKVLEWMFIFYKINVSNFQLFVFDNSRNIEKRFEIKVLCEKHKIPYLSLPKNFTTHPNRSHGMAMSWVYHRIVKKIIPDWFCFLDHDMIPIRKINTKFKNNNLYYGVYRPSNRSHHWSLWAGYCFFNYKKIKKVNLNFLYDHSKNLDTGGRNWEVLYKKSNLSGLNFPDQKNIKIIFSRSIQNTIYVIDDSWLHIGGMSYSKKTYIDDVYNPNGFYSKLFSELILGKSIASIIKSTKSFYINKSFKTPK